MGKNIVLPLILFLLLSCNKSNIVSFEEVVYGETITLSNSSYNYLLNNNITDFELYVKNPDRSKTILTEGVDYKIDDNKIILLEGCTKVKDFSEHKVKYGADGKFVFSGVPRNPELTIEFQIYADYSYRTEFPVVILPNSLTSSKIKPNTKSLKIVNIGTSISFSAHTFENFYHNNDYQSFVYLLSKTISKLYGIQVETVIKSTDGGGVNQIQDLTEIITENPDIVILELGMNDHIRKDPNYEYYVNSLDRAIVELQTKDIEVILVGFFQQNDDWELEYPKNTIRYNETLKELSVKYNLYFADLYRVFSLFDKQKLIRDLMGDYMHHPTSFGHQLYYLELMPYFLKSPKNKRNLLELIYE